MNRLGCIRLIVSLSIGLFASSLCGQSTSENQAKASAESSSEPQVVGDADSSQASSGGGEQQMHYAPALDGSGLISMNNAVTNRLLVGAVASGGWDSNPDNLENGESSGTYTLSPYFGVQVNRNTTQLLLQYQPTITGYSSSSYARQTMHAASVAISGDESERWKWDLKAAGSYGQDSTRLVAPQQSVVVGQVAATDPNSASYLPSDGTVAYATGSAGIHYRRSERDSIEVDVANTFSQYSGLSEKSNIATANLGYDRALSPDAEVHVYGQSYRYYGSIHCTSFGGGMGVKWHTRDRVFLALSGGPQLNTSACGKQQGFAYSAAFSIRLSGKSQLYLLTAREPTVSYLGPGLWQTSVSGGYQRQVTDVGTIRFDAGYALSNTLTTVTSYHGTYFDCVYSYRLGHGLSASYSYRGYLGQSGKTNFSRNVALFSVAWTPSAGRLFQ
jgi:hypothetical protein